MDGSEDHGAYEPMVVVSTGVPASQLSSQSPAAQQYAPTTAFLPDARGFAQQEAPLQLLASSRGGGLRLCGNELTRRAVVVLYSCAAALVLILGCSGDGAISDTDGKRFLFFDTPSTAPGRTRAGFQCSGGGLATLRASLGLGFFSLFLALLAAALSTSLACKGACVLFGVGVSWRSPERRLFVLHAASWMLLSIAIIVWLVDLGLLGGFDAACSLCLRESWRNGGNCSAPWISAGPHGRGPGRDEPPDSRGPRPFDCVCGYVGNSHWGGNQSAGLSSGLKMERLIPYDQRRTSHDITGDRMRVYGFGIAASFLATIAILLQIPVLLVAPAAFDAKRERALAAATGIGSAGGARGGFGPADLTMEGI